MTRRALPALALAATLAACATTDPDAPVTRRNAERALPPNVVAAVPEADRPVEAPALPRLVRRPGPAADVFVGRPVTALEELIGLPALVRREGSTEFRRYDITEDCRAYVLALPEGGTVLSLETGAAIQGMPDPAFEDCTATEDFVGS